MENESKSIFSLLPLLPFLYAATAISSLGPPHLIPENYVMERVVLEGSRVVLPCPVQAADPDSLFFEWYRGNEPLNIFYEDRFRVQSNGVLKIKSALPQDSGVYVCRAVNGFGKLDTNVSLVVLAANDKIQESESTFRNYIHSDREIPRLTNVTRTANGRLSRTTGGSLRLMCKATGFPEPQITWLKNGQPLNSSFSATFKKGRWSLYLPSVQDGDEGNYTCVAYNLYGHSNYTVVLDVIPGDRKKPELRGIHPINTTVEEGGTAVFQCKVKSDVLPHVQWLKQADPDEAESEGEKVIKIHGEYFYILKSTEVVESSDGSFINRLILKGVGKKDGGKYICLGANTIGYSYRGAFLTIRGSSETFIAELENTSNQSHPHRTLFIIIPVVLAILITFLAIALLHHFHKPRSDPSGVQAKHDANDEDKSNVAPPFVYPHVHNVSIMDNPNLHHALESSDGTWSHVQSSLVIDPGQPDSFSECNSSFVFLGDLNMYPDIMYKNNVLGLYSPPTQDKSLCLDRV